MSYNPVRAVIIDGQDVSRQIVSLSYEDHAVDVDMLTLEIANPDGKWSDSEVFAQGKTVELFLGYGRALTKMFKGTLVRPELSFPETGVPTMTVRAYDLSYRMRRSEEKTQTTWQNVTDSQLAAEIASRYGFKTNQMVIDQTPEIIPYAAQGNLTDWEFLKERALRRGFELYVEQDDFHFHAPKDYLRKISGALEYRRNLKSFEPRLSVEEQVSKVVVKGWDAQTKTPIVAMATSASVAGRPVLGSQSAADFVREDFGDNAKILFDKVPATQKEAEDIAQAYFKQKEFTLIEAQGACVGTVDLKAKSLLEIAGCGKKFSGLYYLTCVTHTLDDNGYLCGFECKRNAIEA